MSPSFSCWKTERDPSPEPQLHIHSLSGLSSPPPALEWSGPVTTTAVHPKERSRRDQPSAAVARAGALRVQEACDLIGPGVRWAGPAWGSGHVCSPPPAEQPAARARPALAAPGPRSSWGPAPPQWHRCGRSDQSRTLP